STPPPTPTPLTEPGREPRRPRSPAQGYFPFSWLRGLSPLSISLSVSGPVMEANVSSGLWLTSPGPSPAKAKSDLNAVMDLVQVVFYTVVCVGGSLGNGLVIWLTARRAGRSVNCVWFLNLAVADFIFSVTRVVPLVKNTFYRRHWPFGAFLCQATSFIKYLNMFCSVFLLAAISLDRLAAVAFPVWSKNRRGPRLAWAAAAGAWGAAAAASLPFYLYRNLVPEGKTKGLKCSLTLGEGPKLTLYLLRLLCGFLVPFVIILACYGALAAVLRRRPATIRSRKPFKVMAAIVVTFFLCWAPYHLFLLLKLAGVKGQAMAVGLPLASSLAYLNSCANPVLYFFMGLDFRRALGRTTLAGAFHTPRERGLWGRERQRQSEVGALARTAVAKGAVQRQMPKEPPAIPPQTPMCFFLTGDLRTSPDEGHRQSWQGLDWQGVVGRE
uniref:G-protein coupled receptors family 1 profile domain-containing protein n=1 Tax=Terrapene triunguis TaxID=2587831 RepID=A0A674K184_9SAUR